METLTIHPSVDGADHGTMLAVLVSVVIPAFNAASTVVRAIDSVRAQHDPATEIIVIDDGSVDETAAVVSEHIRNIATARLVRMGKNSGVSAARNAGIRVARGKFLAFLDADDVWLSGKLSKQLAQIQADSSVALVSCNSRLISADGHPLKEGHVNRPPVEGADAWKTLLAYNFIPTPTVLARADMVRACGGFDESLAVGEDLDLWIKLGAQGKIVVLREILINYYDLAASLMKRHKQQAHNIVIPMLEKHIAQQNHRLSAREIRGLRGQRSFRMGCDLFFSGSYRDCVPLFLSAARYGTRPFKSLSYIPRALIHQLVSDDRYAPRR